jgi:hypothetical protein
MAITISGSGITSSEIADGTITNADINASAGIVGSKLSSGAVLQVVTNVHPNSHVVATNTAGGQSSLYGLDIGRVYVDLISITITPKSSSSRLLFFSNVGMSSQTQSSAGAWGCSLVKDNVTGYPRSTYPNYTASSMPGYASDISQHWEVISGSTASATYYLKGFAYNESGANQAQQFRSRHGQFTLMEIAP